jgi:hypothetical protein
MLSSCWMHSLPCQLSYFVLTVCIRHLLSMKWVVTLMHLWVDLFHNKFCHIYLWTPEYLNHSSGKGHEIACIHKTQRCFHMYWPKFLMPDFYISKIWKLCQNLRSIDIDIVCDLHSWTVKAQTIGIDFVIIQPWPLLLKRMLSDFDMFSGF